MYFQRGRSIGWIGQTLQVSKETVSVWLGRPCRDTAVEDWATTRRKRLRVEAALRRVDRVPGILTFPDFRRLVGVGVSQEYIREVLGPERLRGLLLVLRRRREEGRRLTYLLRLRQVARKLGRTPTGIEFIRFSGISMETILKYFGSVRAAQIAIGCTPHEVGEWRPRYRTKKTAAKLAAKAAG